MGKKEETSRWSIFVKTGDHKGSGSDANIFVAFTDEEGNKSENIKLDVKWRNDFQRGQEESFPCESLSNNNKIKTPCTMEIWRDNAKVFLFGSEPNWYCETVKLKTPDSEFVFPVLRWVEPGYHYKIPLNDTSLPQNDPFPDQRGKELEIAKEKYKFKVNGPNLPVTLDKLPDEEKFSDDARRDLKDTKKTTRSALLFNMLDFRRWTKFEHVERLYSFEKSFVKPRVGEFWKSDEWFAAQRLVGANPMVIKLCTEIPANFSVTNELVQPFLEGLTIEEAVERKKLFIVDYTTADGVYTKEGFHFCAPFVLFFLNSSDKLLPVAIQLFQNTNNPVFTPGIDEHKWTLAKMWFNVVDSCYHQVCYHLGLTHLAMDGIAVTVNRCLAKNHPIFRLLAPHFLYLFAIDNLALTKLINPEGTVDNTLGCGVKGGFQLLSRLWPHWSLDVNGTLSKDMESRGVEDPSILPEFPYRDDGILLYNAIKKYVTDIVNIYYDSEDTISKDSELQEWARVLVAPIKDGGVAIKGIPNDGTFLTKEDIVVVCAAVIFTCSAQHAAVNFGQYDNYGVPFNYPGQLKGFPPTDKDPITEETIVSSLPPKENILELMAITKVLSQKGTNSLGYWEVRYQYDPKAIEAEQRFKEDLKSVSEVIKKRNVERNEMYQYTYLNPENVPNAISI